MVSATQCRTQSERADQTKSRILDAAVREFSEKGLAGARTEQIAEIAGVNKALLYYYFKSKEALYKAALECVALRVLNSSMAALSPARTAGEQILRYALNHFDRIHSQREFQNLMQQEMVRLRQGEESSFARIAELVFRPHMSKLNELVEEGKKNGELIDADGSQIMYAAMGANVFYFLSAPVMGILNNIDTLTRSAMEQRRKLAIEYLGLAIFTDRKYGAEVAARVLASTPMPESGEFKMFERKLK
jgi:TetR/AcrR family transcriptional regulator